MYWKRKVLLFKSEVTPGTDPVPTAGANAVLCRNVKLSPLIQEGEDRELDVNYVGNKGRIIAGAYQKLSGQIEIAGAGAAGTAAPYGALLKACGMSQTTTPAVSDVFAPVNPGAEVSGTFYFYYGGRLHKASYAVGNLGVTMNRGKIGTFNFEFTGLYVIPADASLPTPTLTAYQKPVAVSNVNTTPMTLHGFAGKFSEFSMDIGNVVPYRNLVGSESVRLVDRDSKGTIKLEDELVATKDWWTIMRNGTLGALSIQHGQVAGNIVVIAGSNVQLVEPDIEEEDKIGMLKLNLLFVPSSAGNDEWSITVK